MIEKKSIKAELDLLKIMLTGFLGTIFGLGLFDFQTKGVYSLVCGLDFIITFSNS